MNLSAKNKNEKTVDVIVATLMMAVFVVEIESGKQL